MNDPTNTPTPIPAPSSDPLLRAWAAVNDHLHSRERPLDTEALCAHARSRLLAAVGTWFEDLAALHPQCSGALLAVLDGFPDEVRASAGETVRRISGEANDAVIAELERDLREHPDAYVRTPSR